MQGRAPPLGCSRLRSAFDEGKCRGGHRDGHVPCDQAPGVKVLQLGQEGRSDLLPFGNKQRALGVRSSCWMIMPGESCSIRYLRTSPSSEFVSSSTSARKNSGLKFLFCRDRLCTASVRDVPLWMSFS